MDWGALLDNPEAAAALKRMLGKSTDEAAQEMNPLMEQIERKQNLDKTFQGAPKDYPPILPKSAAESAGTFDSPENKQGVLQGDSYGPEKPNFQLQGQPYSGNVPSTEVLDSTGKPIPRVSGPPAIREAAWPEERDVTPNGGAGEGPLIKPPEGDQSKWLSDDPNENLEDPEAVEKQPMSKGKKLAVGAAALATGLGGLAYLGQKNDSGNSDAPSTTPPAAKAEINAEPSDDSDELDSAKGEDRDLKSKRGVSSSAVDPKEAQMHQAISNLLNFNNPGGPNALDKVLAERRSELRSANINEGLARMGAGFARINPELGIYQQQRKDANLPLEEFQLRQKNEAQDPNSGMSSGMRDYIKTLGVNVPPTASAAQIQQVLPYVFKDIEAKQAQSARHDDLKYKQQELALRKSELQSNRDLLRQDKLNQQDQKRIDSFSKSLDNEILRGQTAAGQAARNYQSVENAKALLNGVTDPNQLDNRQVFELTRVLDRILSQGNPSMFGSEHLTPDTARGRLAKIMEYWTNQRQGSGAGSFVKTLSDTLNREGMLAQQQLHRHQMEMLGGNQDLASRHPDQMKDILQARGLPADSFETKEYRNIQRPNFNSDSVDMGHPQDQTALNQILKNNPGITLDAALKALQKYKAGQR